MADKSKFIISIVERLLTRCDGQVINFDENTAIISTCKDTPENLYNSVGNPVMGLHMANKPDLAQKFIDKAG